MDVWFKFWNDQSKVFKIIIKEKVNVALYKIENTGIQDIFILIST